jgi:predicted DNA-binding ribbon-helix-helix protein
MNKHSVTVEGHRTSISLEPEFWDEFCRLCSGHGVAIGDAIAEIDRTRNTNLSSAIRLYVLEQIMKAKKKTPTRKSRKKKA